MIKIKCFKGYKGDVKSLVTNKSDLHPELVYDIKDVHANEKERLERIIDNVDAYKLVLQKDSMGYLLCENIKKDILNECELEEEDE